MRQDMCPAKTVGRNPIIQVENLDDVAGLFQQIFLKDPKNLQAFNLRRAVQQLCDDWICKLQRLVRLPQHLIGKVNLRNLLKQR